MTVFSFYIFDRHSAFHQAECIYSKRWAQRPISQSIKTAQRQSGGASSINTTDVPGVVNPRALSNEDDAKLIFGAIFSLRRMTRQLGGEDDR
jgi:hypothetical protein